MKMNNQNVKNNADNSRVRNYVLPLLLFFDLPCAAYYIWVISTSFSGPGICMDLSGFAGIILSGTPFFNMLPYLFLYDWQNKEKKYNKFYFYHIVADSILVLLGIGYSLFWLILLR
jgi:hypothetical protein